MLVGLTIVQNTFLPRFDVAQESDESQRRENVDIFLIANTEMRRKDSGEGKLQRLSGDKTSYFAHIPHSERQSEACSSGSGCSVERAHIIMWWTRPTLAVRADILRNLQQGRKKVQTRYDSIFLKLYFHPVEWRMVKC